MRKWLKERNKGVLADKPHKDDPAPSQQSMPTGATGAWRPWRSVGYLLNEEPGRRLLTPLYKPPG